MTQISITEVKRKYSKTLMKIQYVNGVGIEEKNGKKIIKIFVSVPNKETLEKIPKILEGYDVEVETVGDIYPQ